MYRDERTELVISHDRLSKLTDGLAAAGITSEILSINQIIDMKGLLTDRQRRIITEAVERGYYDSPRRCTLVELASALDISKPTASGIIHRAEERIIKAFVADPTE